MFNSKEPLKPMNITTRITHFARQKPDAVALVCDDDAMTWGELECTLTALGGYLLARFRVEQPLGVCLPNTPALILIFLAAARAGFETAMLDPEWPLSRIQSVKDGLNPCGIIDDGFFLAEASFHDVFEGVKSQPPFKPFTPALEDALFYRGYTSGSSGAPKGYRRTHASWLASFAASDAEFGICEKDTVLVLGNLMHSLPLYGVVHALHAGAKAIFSKHFHPSLLQKTIKNHDATVMYGTPTQLGLMAQLGASDPIKSLKRVLSSGDKLGALTKKSLNTAYQHTLIDEFYGASELSFITVAKHVENVPLASVGRAMFGVTLSVRNEKGEALAALQEGYVCVQSAMTFHSYDAPHHTSLLRFGETLSVGDRGYVDANGYLFLTGRASRLIIQGGRNIAPEGIESALCSHPAIAHATIVPLHDDLRGERLFAILQLSEGAVLTRGALYEHLRSHCADYEIPRHYGVVSTWPHLASGKTDFLTLRSWYDEGKVEEIP
jgi:long-chain acyl-CoA synthetase